MNNRHLLKITALLACALFCINTSVQAEAAIKQKAESTTETNGQKDEAFRQDNGETIKKEPLRINPGDKRPADQYKVDVFGHPLTIGGAYELEPRYTEDRRLDPRRDDDIANIYQNLKLELFYKWSQSLSFFVQSDFTYDPDVYAESKVYDKELGARVSQAWLFAHRLFDSGFSLQVGRQRMADKRQWWWNENLDAVRLYFGEDDLFAEVAVSKELGVKRTDRDFIEPLHNRVFRVQGDVFWQWTEKQNLSLFFLSQSDTSDTQQIGDVVLQDREDNRDGDLTWIGGRAMGKVKFKGIGKFAYWLDSAAVFGNENTLTFDGIDNKYSRVDSRNYKQVWGWGLDAGATWYSNWFLEPYFTVGYAQGSGDNDPSDGLDTNFRQTGIHNNKVKFSGSQRFRYYGELFRPELSNLKIMTAAVGIPLSEHSSIDLLYHHYAQTTPSNFLRDSRIRATPNGIESHLGDEVDLIVSLDEWKHLQLQAAGSLFIAGDAFGELSGNTSFQIAFTAKYSF